MMPTILLVTGNQHVLDSNPGSSGLYDFLAEYVHKRGCIIERVTPEKAQKRGTIHSGIEYLLAHSAGTTLILQGYRPELFPKVKGVVLFDPNEEYAQQWNGWTVPKVAFISVAAGRPYAYGFLNSVFLEDGHFFLNSFQKIKEGLDGMIIGSG